MTTNHGRTGYRYGCRCDTCTTENSAYQAEYYARVTRRRMGAGRIDSQILVTHVDRLLAQGMSREQIANEAGVSHSTICTLGARPTVYSDVARKVLAVTPKRALKVDAIGSTRRVRALIAIGWNRRAISEQSGVSSKIVGQLASKTPRCSLRTAEAIDSAYVALRSMPGPDAHAKAFAYSRKWPRPDAWTADTIDNPDAQHLSLIERRAQEAADMIDDVTHLARGGCTLESASARLGYDKPSSLEKALRRHDRGDLIATMRRNDPGYIDPARRLTYQEQQRIINHVAGASGYGPDMGRGRKAA